MHPQPRIAAGNASEASTALRDYLLPLDTQTPTSSLIGQALLWLGLVVWGIHFIRCDWRDGDAAESFLHGVNLAFHEFGHLLLRPFGEWLTFLGGSLLQCLLPLIIVVVFLLRERQPFSASVALWWAGQNLIDVAPYIGDARAMSLPLVGEWHEEMIELRALRHDWRNLLEPLGLLAWDHRLAALAHFLGSGVIMLSWAWGACYLLASWRRQQEIP
ncbi:hypothetical protein [Chitinimonas sp.]|uniref:hypothetical protein n=1 Tax=Chitinimonas sp. TaxID=1934313 RepID=UPI0035B1FF43